MKGHVGCLGHCESYRQHFRRRLAEEMLYLATSGRGRPDAHCSRATEKRDGLEMSCCCCCFPLRPMSKLRPSYGSEIWTDRLDGYLCSHIRSSYARPRKGKHQVTVTLDGIRTTKIRAASRAWSSAYF